MRLFAEMPYYKWFGMHPDIRENSVPSIRFHYLLYALATLFDSNDMEGKLFIFGEEGQEGKLEPFYKVLLPEGIELAVHFDGGIGINVTSPRPLAVDWLGLFDTNRACGRQPVFSANSYSQNHSNFSLILNSSDKIFAFLLLLTHAN